MIKDLYIQPSFSALAKVAAGKPAFRENRELLKYHQKNECSNFTGMAGPVETVAQTLLGGWPKGVSAMQKAGEGLTLPPVPSIRRKVRFSAQGDELDIHAVRNGRLDRAWRSAPRVTCNGPGRVRIIINVVANAGVDAKTLHWRGAAGLALAKSLSAAGYSVQIDALVSVTGLVSGGYEHPGAFLATVKPYSAPLNVAALAGLTAHPAAFRRVFFCWMVAAPKHRVSSTLGSPYATSVQELRKALHLTNDATTILYVPHTLLSENAARDWCRNSVRDVIAQGAR